MPKSHDLNPRSMKCGTGLPGKLGSRPAIGIIGFEERRKPPWRDTIPPGECENSGRAPTGRRATTVNRMSERDLPGRSHFRQQFLLAAGKYISLPSSGSAGFATLHNPLGRHDAGLLVGCTTRPHWSTCHGDPSYPARASQRAETISFGGCHTGASAAWCRLWPQSELARFCAYRDWCSSLARRSRVLEQIAIRWNRGSDPHRVNLLPPKNLERFHVSGNRSRATCREHGASLRVAASPPLPRSKTVAASLC